ncbi:tRNA (adenosine(37)-N6)-threonylcarbamoyltransferase complex ATPase subunit type 1 TsaE [Shewanella sp. AS1]|uniref:tRNA (adenosine(37)-N6)-threonylcarbamoyltransferase complex ATPase subunit type 1 TsaE n=1 Tax=Shewanella sp. AS1 TaxID=2907626 RepID=UPI001F0210BF|nr:tRNA (adenosine(37)-N6)-threonylcarbamoyltransferase complex ATPase subunit type 1 TsaE [Shewanella sp. AS1]MCE9677612.1 tRNA (adenosine(37)-N6)-threonylcarbamoyltransferase complex ATPase subunit type 1 TsaE [Shewanella sp. AS1]
MVPVKVYLENESETVSLGQQLAQAIQPPLTLYLSGELGAGKTTFSRGLIQSLGHKGAVKSPTYTLVEPYELNGIDVFHFDLYRLSDPEELEFMGIRDYFADTSLCIVEWPDKGAGILPKADLLIDIQYLNQAREVTLTPQTPAGEKLLVTIHNNDKT